MANVGYIQTAKSEIYTNAHILSSARADYGYFVLSGCDVTQSGTPGMSVVVDAGYVQCGWSTARKQVTTGTLTVTAAHATLSRIDVVYVDINGTIGIYDGTAAAISPASETNYKKMAAPAPGASIPAGVILALVYVGPTVTTIVNANINDIASWGAYTVESPTSTTSGKVPYWSSTAKTLSDGYTVGTSANNLLQLDSSGKIAVTNIASGGTGQTIVQGASVPAWTTRTFDVGFPFGDGSAVIPAGAQTYRIPITSKIVAARIRSYDSAGAPLSGSITCTLYKHALSAAIGSTVDTFTISSATYYEETGLNISVTAGDWLTIITSGITTCTQILCSLTLEGQ